MSFPSSLDSFPTLVDNVDNILASHPNNLATAVAALEAKVGVNSSAVTTSVDYLLSNLPAQNSNWNAGATRNISAQNFTSVVSTGTAPLVVTSTTKVSNLNVDQLDSLDSTDFARITGATPQTVAPVTTFSSFPVGPNANPTTALQLANKQYVDASVTATTALGSFVAKTVGTIYQAATDGFVMTSTQSSGACNGYIQIVTDNSAAPATTTAIQYFNNVVDTVGGSIMSAVRKNDYYQVNVSNGHNNIMYFISFS